MRNENIIPITKGKEISIKNIKEELKKMQTRAMQLYKKIAEESKWREEMYRQELAKNVENINPDLIISLMDEIKDLDDKGSQLETEIINLWDKLDELRDKEFDIEEATQALELYNQIAAEVDKITKNPKE